jgi:signal transduction histidine kinase
MEKMKDGGATALEKLVNQIAHDVRNHAFTMGLQAEMGARRTAEAPEIKTHFDAILRQVDALKHYIEQLLLYGRPVTLTPLSVDLASLIREQVQRLQFSADPGAAPLDIRVEVEGQLRRGNWYPHALAHALMAVLDNAIRSARPSPPVVATVRGDNHCAVVEIRDAGSGISPEAMAKLAVPMAVRRTGGAGLGLAIARKMVEAHGGRLELESGPGGTTVRLTLPWETLADEPPSGA